MRTERETLLTRCLHLEQRIYETEQDREMWKRAARLMRKQAYEWRSRPRALGATGTERPMRLRGVE